MSPKLTLQAMPGQFLDLVAWDEAGCEALRLPLEPEPALRLAARLVEAALAEQRARRRRVTPPDTLPPAATG